MLAFARKCEGDYVFLFVTFIRRLFSFNWIMKKSAVLSVTRGAFSVAALCIVIVFETAMTQVQLFCNDFAPVNRVP